MHKYIHIFIYLLYIYLYMYTYVHSVPPIYYDHNVRAYDSEAFSYLNAVRIHLYYAMCMSPI